MEVKWSASPNDRKNRVTRWKDGKVGVPVAAVGFREKRWIFRCSQRNQMKCLAFCYSHHAFSYTHTLTNKCGPDSSVGIATDNGLDGPGSNPGGDEIFRPSRPALGPTQLPVKWSFPRVKCGRGVLLTTHPLLVPQSWKSIAIPLPTLWATQGL